MDASPAESTEEYIKTGQALNWQASEYVYHPKPASWYVFLTAIIAGLLAVAFLTHQWMSMGVFVVMAVAFGLYANKKPRVLNYLADDRGITVENKFYPYESFRSFSLIHEASWSTIDLEPTRRFMPRLSILINDEQGDSIVDLLTNNLPREDRSPDTIEKLTRYLRF
jgi:hypothetical protein